MLSMAREHGTIRRFGALGFGFIAMDNGADVFVHVTDMIDRVTPTPGDRVQLSVRKEPDGRRRAARVKLLVQQ
jgi:cold shock CspA family protein